MLSADRAFADLIGKGIFFILGIAVIICVRTTFQFIRSVVRVHEREYVKLIVRETLLRLILVICILLSIIMYLTAIPVVFSSFSLVISLSVILYIIFSIKFYDNYQMSAPLVGAQRDDIRNKLKSDNLLTRTELSITMMIFDGYTRDEICQRHSITPKTLKRHLQSVYSKTIDKNNWNPSSKIGKMQRLTVFLHTLQS
jgi:DNA-binding CsgD family transcriptional regulator